MADVFQPKFLSPQQINQESGGKQFDSSGNPLTSKAGAVGAAQVLPSTGPEAARYAGVPWDPEKFQNDREYNLRLGDAYMGHLRSHYGGDTEKAKAAYNAGIGRVDKLIAVHGNDWRDYLPGETKDYIGYRGNGMSKVDEAMADAGLGTPFSLGNAKSPSEIAGRTAFSTQPGSQANETPIVNPFQLGADAKSRVDAAQADVNATSGLVDQNAQTIHEVQTERQNDLSQAVEAKGRVLDDLIAKNRQMMDNVNPLLVKRNQVDQRLGELATMNPLVRGIKGIFDLNYNTKYLSKVSDELGAAATDQAKNYEVVQSLQDQFLKDIDASYANKDSLRELKLTNADQDAAILARHLQASFQNVDILNQSLATQRNLIAAQHAATDDALEALTPQDRVVALSKAQADPTNSININGVRISQADLANRVLRDQQQDLTIQSANLAAKNQQIELHDNLAKHLAESMTLPQLRTTLNNGGVYQGVRIPNAILAQNIASLEGANALNAESLVSQSGASQVKFLIQDAANNVKSFVDKATPLGVVKGAPYKALSAVLNQGTQLTKQYTEAQSRGDTKAMDAIGQEIQNLNQQTKTIIGSVAQSITGDKNAAQSLASYWLGQAVPADVALQTMMGFVNKGGLPIAMRATPTFSAAYAATKQVMDSVDQQAKAQYGNNTTAYNRWLKSPDRMQAISEGVAKAAPAAINQANWDAFNDKLPSIAKATGAKFGNISQSDWELVNAQAHNDAITQAAQKLGIQPNEVEAYFSNGTPPQSLIQGRSTDSAQAAIKNLGTIAPQVQAQIPVWQRSALLNHLDQLPSASNDFRPSQAYLDYVTSSDFLKQAGRFEQTQNQFSYGDYVGGAMRGQGLIPLAQGYGNSIKQLWVQNQIQSAAAADQGRGNYGSIPAVRTRTIMGAMSDLSESDEELFMQVLEHKFPGLNKPIQTNRTNDAVRSFILSSKLPDPRLESIRKNVAKQWDPVSQTMDKAIQRLRSYNSAKSISESHGGGYFPLG